LIDQQFYFFPLCYVILSQQGQQQAPGNLEFMDASNYGGGGG
jgi:hypothetical protein